MLGSIVLAVTPGFRLTIGNVAVFVFGAFPGLFVLPNLYVNVLGGVITGRVGVLGLAFLGALITGTMLVWLKMHVLRMLKK